MGLNIQNRRSFVAGEIPDSLLPGQIAFNLPDSLEFIGDGSDTRKDAAGTVVLPNPPAGQGFRTVGLGGGTPGPQGPQGLTGATGPQGIQGIPGNTGAPGPVGPQGIAGPPGPQGVQGFDGLQGPAGPQGNVGPGIDFQGSVATVGDLPSPSTAGFGYFVQADSDFYIYSATGTWVNAGSIQGLQGVAGIQGPPGPQGATGAVGASGALGPAGPQGPQGIQGNPGSQGPAGVAGPEGPQGGPGPIGPQGIQGVQGPIGPVGPEGPQGQPGLGIDFQGSVANPAALPTPSTQGYAYYVTSTTSIWIYDADNTWVDGGPIQGPVGPQGPAGPTGPQGPAGAAGGVVQILAGTNVTLSPADGLGTVTINATGGGGGSPATPTTEGTVVGLTDAAGTTFTAALGLYAGAGITTGLANTLIGAAAGTALTESQGNTFVGAGAGYVASGDGMGASNNVGVGFQSLFGLTTGSNNIGIGPLSGSALTTEERNVIIGGYGGDAGENDNVFLSTSVGQLRLKINSTGAMGIGGDNYGNSYEVLTSLGSGLPPGWGPLGSGTPTTGYVLTAQGIGTQPSWEPAGGGGGGGTPATPIAEGTLYGYSNSSTGKDNTLLGYNAFPAGAGATSSSRNVAIGYTSLESALVSSLDNVAVGYSALGNQTTNIQRNVGIGTNAILGLTGNNNVGVGYLALSAASGTGGNNTAVGSNAGGKTTSGIGNTFIGFNAGRDNTSGLQNVAIGSGAGVNLTTGNNNTFIGGYGGAAGMFQTVALSDGAGGIRFFSNSFGSISFDGLTFGNPGQVLTSSGSFAKPIWSYPDTNWSMRASRTSQLGLGQDISNGQWINFVDIEYTPISPARITAAATGSFNGTEFTISSGTFFITLDLQVLLWLDGGGNITTNGELTIMPMLTNGTQLSPASEIDVKVGSLNAYAASPRTSISFIYSNSSGGNQTFRFVRTDGRTGSVRIGNPVCNIICID